MILSSNVSNTVQELSIDTYINLKKPMFLFMASSVFLISVIQVVNAATCAPDVRYLTPRLNGEMYGSDNETIQSAIDVCKSKHCDNPFSHAEDSYKYNINTCSQMLETGSFNSGNSRESLTDCVLIYKEKLKQLDCFRDGGQFASSSADFDVNGNYTGSSQQASNKKSKSGNNQEQVASADLPEWMSNRSQEERDAFNKAREQSKKKTYRKLGHCMDLVKVKGSWKIYNKCDVKVSYTVCWGSNASYLRCENQQFGGWWVKPNGYDSISGPGDDKYHFIWFAACEFPGIESNVKWSFPKGFSYSCK